MHIAFFGPANSGKSTLVNALCGQEVSLVSPHPGTTTDPVRKAVELPGLGACVLIDTAGLDDESLLGPERRRRSLSILDEADIAVVLVGSQVRLPVQMLDQRERKDTLNASSGPDFGPEGTDIPVVYVFPKADLGGAAPEGAIPVSAVSGEGIPELLHQLAALAPKMEEKGLMEGLVKAGDCVLLVMPQDSEAPKGRLILPQVQVLRTGVAMHYAARRNPFHRPWNGLIRT